jgi:hypothetical protein
MCERFAPPEATARISALDSRKKWPTLKFISLVIGKTALGCRTGISVLWDVKGIVWKCFVDGLQNSLG